MNLSDKPDAGYTPRPGSKVAAAIQAMLDGPMTADALGPLMKVPPCSVTAMLKQPLQHKLVTRWQDPSGLVHFACGGMAVDEQFKPYEPPPARTPKAKPPTPVENAPHFVAPPNSADPFGLVAKQAAERARAGQRPSRPAPEQASPAQLDVPTFLKPASAAPAPARPGSVPASDATFVAALFSTGELLIQIGADSVRLSRDHQRQLQQYVSRFKE